jgi:2-polyprenyl-6-methoxyphenol hydroxylase-like FAD-dependent oxidoreductase
MSDCPIVITGAGIGGLVLALSLKKHCGVPAKDIEVYEQAPAFGDNVGGAMGLYANGLRVLRDVSPDLLATVREAGYDYIYRRWQRHDGSEVACAREAELTDDPDLQSIGIRRWKLQKALCDASAAAGIVIHFGKRADKVEPKADGTGSVLTFLDGTTRTAKIVFGADGLRSKTREAVVGSLAAEFTGVTCLMGAAKVARPIRGICFPSSRTTKNHGCFYPTGDEEQIFQLYFPARTMEEAWGTLSPEEGRARCVELAGKLEKDGWDNIFLEPLRKAEAVIKVNAWPSHRALSLNLRTAMPLPCVHCSAQLSDTALLAVLTLCVSACVRAQHNRWASSPASR